MYHKKYVKYKNKYLKLSQLIGGTEKRNTFIIPLHKPESKPESKPIILHEPESESKPESKPIILHEPDSLVDVHIYIYSLNNDTIDMNKIKAIPTLIKDEIPDIRNSITEITEHVKEPKDFNWSNDNLQYIINEIMTEYFDLYLKYDILIKTKLDIFSKGDLSEDVKKLTLSINKKLKSEPFYMIESYSHFFIRDKYNKILIIILIYIP